MTIRRLQAALLLVCGLAAVGCEGAADDTSVAAHFRRFARAVEQEPPSPDAPGIAVAVVEQGVVTFAQDFVQKVARRSDPVLPTTLFRIGSCTKMLTVDNFACTVSGQAQPLTFIADATCTYTYGRYRPYVATRTSGP